MGKTLAYGEISIVDLTDGKQVQAYLTSNQPNIVVYDPNSVQQYTPNWSSSTLTLTPVVFIDNEQIGLTDNGVTISWQRQAGSGSATDLLVGETVSQGVLNVTNNMLASISSGLLTYICNVSYTDPDSKITAETRVQMSFSLVKNATELKDCSITGDQTFKYNGSGTLTSASSITLTANLTNTTLKQWQYKKSDGTFAAYPNATTATTLTVKATDAVFVNDIAVIKLVTADDDIFDLHQIIKLRDGAAGQDTYTCILSNDTQSIPCSANGTLYSTSLNGCDTTITIYKGGTDDTASWSITATPSTGVTGTYDSTTLTYTVTGITVDSGYVEFICAKSGQANIIKRFTINKDRSGSDGNDAVIYQLSTDVAIMKINASNVFSPTSAIFSASKRVGNAVASTVYSGRFKIYETTDDSTYTLKYTSNSDESSKTYSPSSTSVKAIKGELYASGNTTVLLDTQVLSVVSDGKNGDAGDDGVDSINVILGNSAEVIPCNSNGTAKAAKDILIPFSCYQGTTRIAGTATLGTLPTGVTLKSNSAATASADGLITLTVASGATLASTNSGDITITITAGGLSSTHKFTWTKSVQATNGTNAILFQIYAPTGDVIVNNNNNVTLQTTLTNGTSSVTSGITYQWAKYTGTEYTNISGATSSSLLVTPDMVESVASFRCQATYSGKTYSAYWCVTDKSDPCRCDVFSTLGSQLVNGVGVGAIYALVFRNGEEIDPIKTTTFSTTAPSNPSSGDFYYKIDKTNKTITLMKYSGSTWVTATGDDLPSLTYNWYRRNASGEALDKETPYKTGKVLYLDNTVVDGKVSFSCKVEE